MEYVLKRCSESWVLLMFLKMVKTYHSQWMSVFSRLFYVWRGFDGKWCFFMNEIRLENSLRLTGFTYVFENDYKFKNVLQFLYVWRRLNGKFFFVNGVSLKRCSEWWVLPMFLQMVKNAMVRGCPCSSVFFMFDEVSMDNKCFCEFVNGISFEKLLRMMGSTYGFENG